MPLGQIYLEAWISSCGPIRHHGQDKMKLNWSSNIEYEVSKATGGDPTGSDASPSILSPINLRVAVVVGVYQGRDGGSDVDGVGDEGG